MTILTEEAAAGGGDPVKRDPQVLEDLKHNTNTPRVVVLKGKKKKKDKDERKEEKTGDDAIKIDAAGDDDATAAKTEGSCSLVTQERDGERSPTTPNRGAGAPLLNSPVAPNTPDVDQDGVPMTSAFNVRRTGKRKAAQIAKQRVAGQLASETQHHPVTGIAKQQRTAAANAAPAYSESPRGTNNSSSSTFAINNNSTGIYNGEVVARKQKPQAARKLVAPKEEYEYKQEEEEVADEYDSSGEFEGVHLSAKLTATYQSLSKQKTPKRELSKSWVALLTAVERELHGNSMKFRGKRGGGSASLPKKKKKDDKGGARAVQKGAKREDKSGSCGGDVAVKAEGAFSSYGGGGQTSHAFLVKKVAGICCHHCQRGKELVRCSRAGCRLHYCTECLKRCYPGLSIEECRDQCPRCMGICNCKYALRMDKRCNKVPKHVGSMPACEPQTKQAFLSHAWENLVCEQNFVASILEDELYELRVEGIVRGREVSMQELESLQDNGYRVLCSKCNTTVINALRTCDECGYDLCPQCCIEMRGVTDKHARDSELGEQAKQDLCCPCKTGEDGESFCGKRLELKRLNYLSKECIGSIESKLLPAVLKAHEERQGKVLEEAPAAKEVLAPGVCQVTTEFLGTEEGFKYFQKHWKRGNPFVVPNVRGKMLWTPHLMKRAATEKRKGEYTTDVIDCSGHQVIEVSIEAFFNGYTGETQFEGNPMYKLKDWPTEEAFKDKLKRLFFDFVDMLPLKEYTHPTAGPLNLASKVPDAVTYKPDMGPKCYIAYGRKEEEKAPGDLLQMDGDSVTKLHLDVADAINVMVHSSSSCEGALWHIFRREDTSKLKAFLFRHKTRFVHNQSNKDMDNITHHTVDPIFDQIFYLSSRALELLKEEEGVVPWTTTQKRNEAVLVPAGCAHQIRNLGSSIKVAMDFISPESLPEVLSLAEAHRKLPNSHFARYDKVMARLMVLNCAWECLEQK